MAERLPKADLHSLVQDAIRASGWQFILLPSGPDGSMLLRLYREASGVPSQTVRVYIWNITHGGGARRPAGEYRIQITGVSQFVQNPGEKTLVLGWWQSGEVFAGWDYRKHAGVLGRSPSFQVAESTLQDATHHLFAVHTKHNQEKPIAFVPDFMGTYIEYLTLLHDMGDTEQSRDLMDTLEHEPQNIPESEIKQLPPERQVVVRTVKEKARSVRFRDKVLSAYGSRCAVCGTQLKLVEAAHIVPVAYPGSTDEVDNGLALCVLHHRSYDNSLLTFRDDFRVMLNGDQIKRLQREQLAEGIDFIRASVLHSPILLPPRNSDRPRKDFIIQGNSLRGWNDILDQAEII